MMYKQVGRVKEGLRGLNHTARSHLGQFVRGWSVLRVQTLQQYDVHAGRQGSDRAHP